MAVELINPASLRQTRTYFQASIGTGTRLICLAGQAGIDAAGEVVGKGDLTAQTEQAYKNVHSALRELGATFADIVKLTVYVPNMAPEHMQPLIEGAQRAGASLGFDMRRPLTLIGVSALANQDWLVEVEAMALAEAAS
jgi:enamine deaminase RidA (YjgF/YER057c/UK114 family)